MRASEWFAAAALGACGVVACGLGSAASPQPQPVVAPGPTADDAEAPTFARVQQIFDARCAFGSCHQGANPAARLDLSHGHACANLVGKPTCVFNARVRVVPGKPESSYLYGKVSGDDLGTDPDGPCAAA